MKKNNNKGFTLMEMLIVVAIIAVLVAIAIPVFTNQLEKAREATDEANIRSAYAEVMACALTDAKDKTNGVDRKDDADGSVTWSKTVVATQKQAKWESGDTVEIAGKQVSATVANTGKSNGWKISYKDSSAETNIEVVSNIGE